MTYKRLRLTQARHGWASSRTQAPQFKGHPLRVPAAVESRYVEALQALCAQMTAQVRREVVRLFEGDAAQAHYAQDDRDARAEALDAWRGYRLPPMAANAQGNARCVQPEPVVWVGDAANIGSQARILVNSLNSRFNALFAKRAPMIAATMADGAEAASKTALHASLKALTGGLSLKTSLMPPKLRAVYRAAVQQNVSLIKTIASEYLGKVEREVMRSITTGQGLADLVPKLEEFEGYTHRKAKNVALDQTRKTYNLINQNRMTAIGVKRFQWIHSGGGAEPRPLHVDMDGEIFSFDNLPVIDERTGERGIPGQAVNCKCTMAPVFDFGDDPETSYDTYAKHK